MASSTERSRRSRMKKRLRKPATWACPKCKQTVTEAEIPYLEVGHQCHGFGPWRNWVRQ